MAKVLIFGDSISWGAFDYEFGGWAERLKTYFLKDYKEEGVGIYNLSVSSNDTRGILEFIEQDIEKINKIEPEEIIILFSIGSNDSRYIRKDENAIIPIEEFEENLKKIIAIAKKYSKKIIFTGLTKINDKLTQPWEGCEFWENKDLGKYDDRVENICEKYQIHFVPLFDLLDESMLEDGLHPNSKGHENIYHRIKDYLLSKIL